MKKETLDNLWSKHEYWKKIQKIYSELCNIMDELNDFFCDEKLQKAYEELRKWLTNNIEHKMEPLFPRDWVNYETGNHI